jgi:hypothetical protein
MSRAFFPEFRPNSQRQKKARQAKSKVKSMLVILFYIKRIVYKEFVLADQTVNSSYYCDFMATARKCAKTSPKSLSTEELAVAAIWSKLTLSVLATITLEEAPFRAYVPIPALLKFFKCNLEGVLCMGIQHCLLLCLDHLNCVKMTAFQFFL